MTILEKAIAKAEEMMWNDYHIHAGMERKVVTKDWTNGVANRTYIKIYCYTLSGRYKGSYDMGYIDNVNNAYVAGEFDLAVTPDALESEEAVETEKMAETVEPEEKINVPELNGTDKQTGYAYDIITSNYNGFIYTANCKESNKNAYRYEDKLLQAKTLRQAAKIYKTMYENGCKSQPEKMANAKWVIDNSYKFEDLITKALEYAGKNNNCDVYELRRLIHHFG